MQKGRTKITYKLILLDIGQAVGQFWQHFGTQCLLQRMYSCLCNNDPFLDQFMIIYRKVIYVIRKIKYLIKNDEDLQDFVNSSSFAGKIVISLEFKTVSLQTQNSLVKENEDFLSHSSSTLFTQVQHFSF